MPDLLAPRHNCALLNGDESSRFWLRSYNFLPIALPRKRRSLPSFHAEKPGIVGKNVHPSGQKLFEITVTESA
jgi:hypothetical protein